jgi:23S rRNA (cytosine1962-C5)-methyltransferase
MPVSLVLKPGKEKSVRNGHPWIFSGAIASCNGSVEAGASVDVVDHKHRFLARASYNPQGSLVARVFSFTPGVEMDADWFHSRLALAEALRSPLRQSGQTMWRLVASEADFMPGLIIDCYGSGMVFQILTAGMERVRELIIRCLRERYNLDFLVERSDESVRRKEGLAERKEVVWVDPLWAKGDALVSLGSVCAEEGGLTFEIDCWEGHKTGFYLDQRQNRAWVRSVSAGRRVLNCFSYTGGFGAAALAGGAAELVNVDESAGALQIGERNCSRAVGGEACNDPGQLLVGSNLVGAERFRSVRADVFKYLRELKAAGEKFDLIVMDPPKFISDRAHIDRACRGYKDLNLLAIQLLREGGILATFSCSGLMSRDLFQKVVFGAAVDAPAQLQVLQHLSQADDHPVLLSFPESLYLKGFLARKVSAS